MSSIRIIDIPPGVLAPLEIREQWVGVQIPLATDEELRQNPIAGKLGNDNDDGHIVLRSKAVKALQRAGRYEAADFWHAAPLGMYLQFKQDVCILVA
ncbi:MAG: hypothetical protein JWN64_297 [Parcubacteria group bacterium]|nr:hypothetical protein [Parcubacteria group bacterium]